MKKIFIGYAWATGCWKSPITNYISTKVCLPTFNTDAIRSEVVEDLLVQNRDEAIKRMKSRLNSIIKEWSSFIYDASVDRTRWDLKDILIKNWYKYFIISIDLDKETLLNFYTVKSYFESMERIDKVYEDHQKFLKEFSEDISVHVNEKNYKDRLKDVYRAVSQRVEKIRMEENGIIKEWIYYIVYNLCNKYCLLVDEMFILLVKILSKNWKSGNIILLK